MFTIHRRRDNWLFTRRDTLEGAIAFADKRHPGEATYILDPENFRVWQRHADGTAEHTPVTDAMRAKRMDDWGF